jgi:hypothetical protein
LEQHRTKAAAAGFDALIANGDAILTAAQHNSAAR